MKILVNGYTVTEHLKLVKNNDDITLVNRLLDHIKKNKLMYGRLVILTAMLLHLDILVYADFGNSLDRVGYQILDMLMAVAKWGCLGIGIKDMVTNTLNGASAKDALNSGLMYLLIYVFISFYPQLYDLFGGIKF